MRRPLGGRRILVVEDEFLVAMSIRAALADMGCDVIGPAARLPKAFQLARAEALDGAVLDININGDRVDPLARELRARGVPIIVLTGYGVRSIAEDLRSLPRLEKPFQADQLEALAAAVFAGR